MKKQGVSRRRFLAFCGGGIAGIWPVGTGLVRLPGKMVFAMSGSCSFCEREARKMFGTEVAPGISQSSPAKLFPGEKSQNSHCRFLAGVTHRNVRVCDECVNMCLEIIAENIAVRTCDDPVEESTNDPKLLAKLVRRLAVDERVNRLIDALGTAIARCADTIIVPPRSGPQIECSFCDKPEREDMTMIAGPTVYICDGCVGDAGTLFMGYGWRPGELESDL